MLPTSVNGNKIKRRGSVTVVEFDPSWLITAATYMPDGDRLVKPNMTLGQMIEFIAFAWVKAKVPQFGDECNAAKIEFEEGKFIVTFAKDKDALLDTH